jgi:hypothetical protein
MTPANEKETCHECNDIRGGPHIRRDKDQKMTNLSSTLAFVPSSSWAPSLENQLGYLAKTPLFSLSVGKMTLQCFLARLFPTQCSSLTLSQNTNKPEFDKSNKLLKSLLYLSITLFAI